jgi:hypothetical protein
MRSQQVTKLYFFVCQEFISHKAEPQKAHKPQKAQKRTDFTFVLFVAYVPFVASVKAPLGKLLVSRRPAGGTPW